MASPCAIAVQSILDKNLIHKCALRVATIGRSTTPFADAEFSEKLKEKEGKKKREELPEGTAVLVFENSCNYCISTSTSS
jgi:hypothetical protein